MHIGLEDGKGNKAIHEEIKIVNQFAFIAILISDVFAALAASIIPEISEFLLGIAVLQTMALVSVILLHHYHLFAVARPIFINCSVITVLALTAYLGMDTNVHYLFIPIFFAWLLIYQHVSTSSFKLVLVSFFAALIGLLAIQYFNILLKPLGNAATDAIKSVVFLLNLTSLASIAVIYFFGEKKRRTRLALTDHELWKRTSLLQNISDNVNEGIYRSTPDKGIVYCNKTFLKLLGYDGFEDIKHLQTEIFYVDPGQRKHILNLLENNGQYTNELINLKKKNGKEFWAFNSATRVVGENNDIFIDGTILDITEQRLVQEKILENEQMFRNLFNNSPMGIVLSNPDGSISRVNKAFCKMLGYGEDEICKMVISNLSPSSEYEHEFSLMGELLEGKKESYNIEKHLPTKSGKKIWVNISVSAMRNSDGEPQHIISILEDITGRRNAEDELRATKNFYEGIINDIPIEVAVLDAEKRYMFLSKKAIDDPVLRQWLVGKNDYDFCKYRDKPLHVAQSREEKLDLAVREKRKVSWEETMTNKYGVPVYNIRNIVPIFDDNDNLQYFLGYSFNVNDQKKIEQQLKEQNSELIKLNEELDRFVYSVSHDLRAPIASVLGLINLAKMEDDFEEVKKYLDMKEEALQRLDTFIQDIIDYSRNKRLNLELEGVDMEKMVHEVLDNYRYLNKNANIRKSIVMEPGFKITTDKRRLTVVLNNLISNAIRYSDLNKADPFIEINAHQNASGYVISVRDNGQGIEQEQIENIWNMFYRANRESTGSGLGLYILKETLEKMSGRVEVESKYGEGTTFNVYLPVIAI